MRATMWSRSHGTAVNCTRCVSSCMATHRRKSVGSTCMRRSAATMFGATSSRRGVPPGARSYCPSTLLERKASSPPISAPVTLPPIAAAVALVDDFFVALSLSTTGSSIALNLAEQAGELEKINAQIDESSAEVGNVALGDEVRSLIKAVYVRLRGGSLTAAQAEKTRENPEEGAARPRRPVDGSQAKRLSPGCGGARGVLRWSRPCWPSPACCASGRCARRSSRWSGARPSCAHRALRASRRGGRTWCRSSRR